VTPPAGALRITWSVTTVGDHWLLPVEESVQLLLFDIGAGLMRRLGISRQRPGADHRTAPPAVLVARERVGGVVAVRSMRDLAVIYQGPERRKGAERRGKRTASGQRTVSERRSGRERRRTPVEPS
jgi:hypothetical protein